LEDRVSFHGKTSGQQATGTSTSTGPSAKSISAAAAAANNQVFDFCNVGRDSPRIQSNG
jgi:hypothetical protein